LSFYSGRKVSEINLTGSNLNMLCMAQRVEGRMPGINRRSRSLALIKIDEASRKFCERIFEFYQPVS